MSEVDAIDPQVEKLLDILAEAILQQVFETIENKPQ